MCSCSQPVVYFLPHNATLGKGSHSIYGIYIRFRTDGSLYNVLRLLALTAGHGCSKGLKVKLGFDFSSIKADIRANVLWDFILV